MPDLKNLKNQTPESSQILAFEYEPETQKLFVQFRSNAARVTYAYNGISPEIAAAAEAAESKGRFFGRPFTSVHTDFEKLPGIGETPQAMQAAETSEAGKEAA